MLPVTSCLVCRPVSEPLAGQVLWRASATGPIFTTSSARQLFHVVWEAYCFLDSTSILVIIELDPVLLYSTGGQSGPDFQENLPELDQ